MESFRRLAWLIGIGLISLIIGLGLYGLGVSSGLATLLGLTSFSHLLLLGLLVRYWLAERYPSVKAALERLPGVQFPVPVPERFRVRAQPSSSAVAASQGHVSGYESATFSASTNPSRNTEREPFTLGTLAFEPPEPFQTEPLERKPLPEPNVEGGSVFERAWRKSGQGRQGSQFDRFVLVCKTLKQFNLEVNVWTESELSNLAQQKLKSSDTERQMVALLMPQNVVTIPRQGSDAFEFHAGIVKAMLKSTGPVVSVAFVNSFKDRDTGDCLVNFEHHGQSVCWQFNEPDHQLSEQFLQTALDWVGSHSQGEFRLLEDTYEQLRFVYLPTTVWETIAQTPAKLI
ncbi:hypothetical protein [Reinekea blandensis]|uniref:Uncharacterized protein n=1 Tax=Reinekea blandensis MED297 TaxID=314283 RepID=A4BCF0_9GAMM|nr:hypothetical protein [Reinekea blandensis]EAR10216.1 hypothetical protein MED297_13372 [Reinekea sp. MED297] [Reinekea blandensis MED297]